MTSDLNPLNAPAQIKNLLVVTTIIEIGAGLALVFCPSILVALLLASPLETSAAVTLGRITGTALFALGIATWFAHYDSGSYAARGLVGAMVLYNLGTSLFLTTAGIKTQPVGIALWPAVILHMAMFLWCITSLSRKQTPAD